VSRSAVPYISLCIPAFNEEAFLPRLLDSVDTARKKYNRGHDAVEVIVANNASTDRTAEIARERGCVVVAVEKRVIAASRNGAARAAKGEIIAFVDADIRIHPESFNAIDEAMASGKHALGATRITMERWSLGIFCTYYLLVPMVRMMGVDGGVVFCRREDFHAVGGYDETKRVAEDVDLLLRVKKLGRKRGQGFARLKGVKAVASCRKFDDHGEWHMLTAPFGMLWDVIRGLGMDRQIDRFWYRVREHRGSRVRPGDGDDTMDSTF
jgi:glycosyltransferase involved in cell wall biosynthesis